MGLVVVLKDHCSVKFGPAKNWNEGWRSGEKCLEHVRTLVLFSLLPFVRSVYCVCFFKGASADPMPNQRHVKAQVACSQTGVAAEAKSRRSRLADSLEEMFWRDVSCCVVLCHAAAKSSVPIRPEVIFRGTRIEG
jgi:hypothetical protein